MKTFLKQNKIYFEIGNIVIFTFVTVVLASLSYNLQLRASERDKVLTQPDIRVRSSLRLEEGTNRYSHEELFIDNIGKRVLEATIVSKDVFILKKFGDRTLVLPVVYYVGTMTYRSTEGTLFRCYQPNNYSRKMALKLEDPNVDFEKFVTIEYVDLFGEIHRKCFTNKSLRWFSGKDACDRLEMLKEITRDLIPVDVDKVNAEVMKKGIAL